MHKEHFFWVNPVPKIYFGMSLILGCIWLDRVNNSYTPTIVISSYFNHPKTPREVIKFMVKHEFLHIEIPPREVDGELKQHPPEFWEKEDLISPEGELIWRWIYDHLFFSLVLKKEKELMYIKKKDFKERRSENRKSLKQILKNNPYLSLSA